MIYVNGELIKTSLFPNGETLVPNNILANLSFNIDMIVIRLKYDSDRDLLLLKFIKDYIDEEYKSKKLEIILSIPYMPYSRMDRSENGSVFTLKSVCKMINDMNFDLVIVEEPHSDVCVALLDRVMVNNVSAKIFNKVATSYDVSENNNDIVVYPDAGAQKRYGKTIPYKRVVVANKERDFKTGYIKNIDIMGEVPNAPFRAFIIDDLCSGGMTFILTAKKLRELGAKEVYLIVAHCENTVYNGELLTNGLINKVFTTDSILNGSKTDKIEIMNI